MEVNVKGRPAPGLRWDPARHERLGDGPWIQNVRAQTGHQHLFVYRHRVTKRFVLAEWHEEGVSCEELCLFSGPPDHGPDDLPTMQWLQNRLRQTPLFNAKRMHEQNWEKRAHEQKMIDSSEDQRSLTIKHLRRKGWHDIADDLQYGLVPYVGSEEAGEKGEESRDRIASAADTKVRSFPPDLTVAR